MIILIMILDLLLCLSAGTIALLISKSYWQTPLDGLDVLIAVLCPIIVFAFTRRGRS